MLAVTMPCTPRALRMTTRRPPPLAAARCGASRSRPRAQQLRVFAAAPSADDKQRPRFPRNLLKPEPTDEETASIVKVTVRCLFVVVSRLHSDVAILPAR